MASLFIENYYFFNFFIMAGMAMVLLIYVGRFNLDNPKTLAFQRLLVGVVSWAFFDAAVSTIGRLYPSQVGFETYRYLSFLFLFFPPAAAELIATLMGPVSNRQRAWIYGPYLLLYITGLLLPDALSALTFNISRGDSGSTSPWNLAFKIYTLCLITLMLINLQIHVLRDTDLIARKEKQLLMLGGCATVIGIVLAQLARVILGPEFPWMANTSTAFICLAAFRGLRRYGRVLSTRSLYKTTLEMTPNGMIHLYEHTIVWANNSMAQMAGYKTPNDLIGRSLADVLNHSFHEEEAFQELVSELSRGRLKNRETMLKTIRGDPVFTLASSKLFDSGNLDQGVLAVFTDITEQKKAEAEQRNHLETLESMERIDRILRQAQDLEQMMAEVLDIVIRTFDCDRAWLLYPCNPNVESLSIPIERTKPGYPGAFESDQFIPMQKEIAEAAKTLLEADGPIRYDPTTAWELPQNISKQFQIRSQMVTAIYPKIGAPWMFGLHQCSHERVWTGPDVVRFKEIGRRITDALSSFLFLRDLHRSEEEYRELVENIDEIIFKANTDGKITFMSPPVQTLFGYLPSEVIGRTLTDFLFPGDLGICLENFKAVINGQHLTIECRALTKNGEVRWVYMSNKPLWDKDRICGFQGTIADIDQRKRMAAEKQKLEEKLARSRKMEALGLLAGGVAHDLNNVLSGIVSYPDLLLLDLPEDSSLKKPIQTIRDSGFKAAAIVQDLLTLARRGVTVSEVLNLNNIIRDYLRSPEHHKIMSYHPEIKIETNFADKLPNINGSPVHLKKMIMNLVSNASEAIPENGSISIATISRYIDQPFKGYDQVEEGTYSMIRVADQGEGIASEDMDRIFEPFYTKKVMGLSGTGLGMAVVWGTVQDHNGYIHVESELGKGTTFDLYFPMTRTEVLHPEKDPDMAIYTGCGQTILVVDDIREQREIASEILTRLGYNVEVASSGEAALELLSRKSVDLIVLDMIMPPGIDGLETYRRILRRKPKQKVIIASGFSENERVREAQSIGAGEYIKKPYTIEKIGTAVKSALT